jgi:hypothetical protein
VPSIQPIAEIILRIHADPQKKMDVELTDHRAGTTETWAVGYSPYNGWTLALIHAQLEQLGWDDGAAQLAGELLGQLLLGAPGGQLDVLLKGLADEASRAKSFVRLLLNIKHPTLKDLPWELAIWPGTDRRLATDPALTLVRLVQPLGGYQTPTAACTPLDVHFVTSMNPCDSDLGYANGNIRKHMGIFAQDSQGKLNVKCTLSSAMDTASSWERDVLYFLGHGARETVAWVDADGRQRLNAPEFLRKVGFESNRARLIVMLSCGGRSCAVPSTSTQQTFASALIDNGTQVVLSMYGLLDVRAAPVLANQVQYHMKDGLPLDMLVQTARHAIRKTEETPGARRYLCKNWYQPVLTTSSSSALDTFRDIRYPRPVPDEKESRQLLDLLEHVFALEGGLPPCAPVTLTPAIPADQAASTWFDGLISYLVTSSAEAVNSTLRELLNRLLEGSREGASFAERWEDLKWGLVAEAAAYGLMPPGSPAEFFSHEQTEYAENRPAATQNVMTDDEPSTRACIKYYAYKPHGDTSPVQLLGAYGGTPWQRWFAPYGQQRWYDPGMRFEEVKLEEHEKYALILAGCSPMRSPDEVRDYLWKVHIPVEVMNKWNIACLPPDPKLPPESGLWKREPLLPPDDVYWRLYSQEEFRAMVDDPPDEGLFRRAVDAVRACASKRSFATIVQTIRCRNSINLDSIKSLAEIFESQRLHTKDNTWAPGDLEDLEVIQAIAAAVPPGMPSPATKLWRHLSEPGSGLEPEQVRKFITMSDHREWQFRLLVAIIEALFTH